MNHLQRSFLKIGGFSLDLWGVYMGSILSVYFVLEIINFENI